MFALTTNNTFFYDVLDIVFLFSLGSDGEGPQSVTIETPNRSVAQCASCAPLSRALSVIITTFIHLQCDYIYTLYYQLSIYIQHHQ